MLVDCRQCRIHIQRKIWVQRHAYIRYAGKCGDHFVHHERRFQTQNRRTGFGDGHGQDLDDLVRAIAEQDVHAFRYFHAGAQTRFQRRGGCVWVAIDSRIVCELAQLCAQGGGQRVRIFHRIQFHETTGIGHVIRGEGADFVADELVWF